MDSQHENLSKNVLGTLGVVVYTYQPTIQEAKAGGLSSYGQAVR